MTVCQVSYVGKSLSEVSVKFIGVSQSMRSDSHSVNKVLFVKGSVGSSDRSISQVGGKSVNKFIRTLKQSDQSFNQWSQSYRSVQSQIVSQSSLSVCYYVGQTGQVCQPVRQVEHSVDYDVQ